MHSKEAEQSAWSHFFNQAVSDLTGMSDIYVDGAVSISAPTGPKVLIEHAVKIADEAVAMLSEKKIPEEYWPTAPK